MAEIELLIPNKEFSAGDTVTGEIVISSDAKVEFNRIYAILRAEEYVRVIRGSRKHRRFFKEKRSHCEDIIDLSGPGSIGLEKKTIPFEFILPDSCPGSYYGIHGWIRYRVEAFLELRDTRRLQTAAELLVFVTSPASTLQSVTTSITENNVDILKVELPENGFILGDDFKVRFWVANQANIRGLRIEIIHREFVTPESIIEDMRRSFSSWYAKKEDIRTDVWNEVELESASNWPQSFRTDLIKSQYILKVTLDIPLRFDKTVEMPIIAAI
jgi:hypothetical protein